MNWNTHLDLKGSHAVLSPSSPYWINYDADKLIEYYTNYQKKIIGTRLHALAEECISLHVRLPNTQITLNQFVNDAIGFRMSTEVTLFYTENAFGTADAISFGDDILRIHDLKTGASPGKMKQLDAYAALFCLEYFVDPNTISIVCRIYQNDEIIEWMPTGKDIQQLMNVIIEHDKVIESIRR